MDYIVENIEEEAFKDEADYQKAQKEFLMFLKYAEKWHILEFISALLGLTAMLCLIIICIFPSKNTGKHNPQFGSNGRI